jgi:hypothetical protein
MFAQVIQGKVKDEGGLRKQLDVWDADLKPGAIGFIGSTSGITDDGKMITIARFENEQAAKKNSDRPEQGAWWAETEKHLSDVSFVDSTDIQINTPSDPNKAGFVQVIQAQAKDINKMKALDEEFGDMMQKVRPDILGSINIVHPDGKTFTSAIYFTSEAEARKYEAQEVPAGERNPAEEYQSMMEGTPTFLDIREPRLS